MTPDDGCGKKHLGCHCDRCRAALSAPPRHYRTWDIPAVGLCGLPAPHAREALSDLPNDELRARAGGVRCPVCRARLIEEAYMRIQRMGEAPKEL